MFVVHIYVLWYVVCISPCHLSSKHGPSLAMFVMVICLLLLYLQEQRAAQVESRLGEMIANSPQSAAMKFDDFKSGDYSRLDKF